jgi:hypothetical protein
MLHQAGPDAQGTLFAVHLVMRFIHVYSCTGKTRSEQQVQNLLVWKAFQTKKTMNIDETTLKFRLMLSYRGV